ncbi:hypothetical protein MNV49_002404 [Pseudohyphozyma bogoriensis]|nr:hypothetical protein MNV49_002404 [Pseudohyphozyma bogoriensis]
MIETVLLARHGFRLSWETQVWSTPTGTPRDPPLSAHGHDQAKELAAWLVNEGKPQLIISSPLTATPASEQLDLPILVEHGVGEWYLPVRRGLHPRSHPAATLKTWFPTIDPSAHDSLVYPTQKGESIVQIHDRAEDIIRRLVAKLDKVEGLRTVVIYTHAATNIAMGRALVGDREREIRSATCSVGKYVRVQGKEAESDGLGEWEMVSNGDCSFLKNGEERHWDFSYVEEYEEDGVLEDGTDAPLASDNYKTPSASSPGKL